MHSLTIYNDATLGAYIVRLGHSDKLQIYSRLLARAISGVVIADRREIAPLCSYSSLRLVCIVQRSARRIESL